MQRPRAQLGGGSAPKAMRRWGAMHGKIDQQSASQVKRGKEIEIPSKPEIIGDRGRDETSDEVARHIAGDVGGGRGCGIDRAWMFAEMCECQRECRRHTQALRDA